MRSSLTSRLCMSALALNHSRAIALARSLAKNCRFLQGKETDQVGLADVRGAIASGQGCKVLLRNYRKKRTSFFGNESYPLAIVLTMLAP